MSYRMKITLPEAIAVQLDELAAATNEPPARVAAQMVRDAIAQAAANGEAPAPVRRVSLSGVVEEDPEARAPWLEPYGGDSCWRARMWGEIVALHGRYANTLRWLQEGWWKDSSRVETLCALAMWRQWIDDAGRDPREELAFQLQLAEYAYKLKGEGGGVTGAWTPGAPPEEWL
jgi:hypothetical protein